MIDFESWPVLLKLAFVIGPFVIGFSGLAINVQIAMSGDFKVALSAITSNPYLEQMKPVWGGGNLRSRCLLLSAVSALVTFPRLYLHMGWIDEQELKDFPPYLKRKMTLALWLIFASLFWILIDYVIIKR
ncbi:hypothetical protein [Pseudomonas sp. AFG_SD02_1510_Pfu_092]|uniref:hypothetical protein n=1 Tax=Pseudomonas sp. AFG_SD02_1510_Pfu_092 TaxID=2259497 RepID=UPI001F4D9E67|nr:hypothetical protein [Pseudomonas sp. AFG_SD02_1510_Pfu_092]